MHNPGVCVSVIEWSSARAEDSGTKSRRPGSAVPRSATVFRGEAASSSASAFRVASAPGIPRLAARFAPALEPLRPARLVASWAPNAKPQTLGSTLTLSVDSSPADVPKPDPRLQAPDRQPTWPSTSRCPTMLRRHNWADAMRCFVPAAGNPRDVSGVGQSVLRISARPWPV